MARMWDPIRVQTRSKPIGPALGGRRYHEKISFFSAHADPPQIVPPNGTPRGGGTRLVHRFLLGALREAALSIFHLRMDRESRGNTDLSVSFLEKHHF